jgi:hypothetical protein
MSTGGNLAAQVAAELANPSGGPRPVVVSNGDLSDQAVRDELRGKLEALQAGTSPV